MAVVGPGAGVGSIGSVYLELDNHPELQASVFTSTQLIERASSAKCFLYINRPVRHWPFGGISFDPLF